MVQLMSNTDNMCKSRLQTDELLDMLSRISRKKSQVRGNLRLEAILEATHKWLSRELKEKQRSRKRKWEEMKLDIYKKSKPDIEIDFMPMEEDSYEDLLSLSDFFNNLKSVSSSSDKHL